MNDMTRNKPIINLGPGSFRPGDQVTIVSGGPDMTVVSVCPDCGEVEAVYCDSQGDLIFNEFPPICLELAS